MACKMKHRAKRQVVSLFLVLMLILLPNSSNSQESKEEELCDLNAWYQETEAEGAFTDPEPEIAALEAQILTVLESDDEDDEIPCSVISEYEEILYGAAEDGEEEEEEGEGGEEEEMDESMDEIPKLEKEYTKDEKSSKLNHKSDSEEEQISHEMGKITLSQEVAEKNSKKETNLKPERNVKVTDDISKEVEAQDVLAEVRVKTPGLSKCKVSSQRYEGVLNGCHCSKDSCSWSEIFLTRQIQRGSTPGKPAHTPQVPKTSSSAPESVESDTESMFNGDKEHLATLNSLYTSKLTELEMQILKLENRVLTDQAGKTSEGATFTNLENQVLKLENELLRINASFLMLQAENAHLRDQVMSEVRSSPYPALPDQNATAMTSLITDHQTRITELTTIINNQNNIIKTLDEKSQLLDEQNIQLIDTLGTQSDMIDGIMRHIGEIRDTQTLHKQELEGDRQKIYDMINSVKVNKELGHADLDIPDTLGGHSEGHHVVKDMETMDNSVKVPGGVVSRDSVVREEEEKTSSENPKLPTMKKDDGTEEKSEESKEIKDEPKELKEETSPETKEVEEVKPKEAEEVKSVEKPVEKPPLKKVLTKGKKGLVRKGKKKVVKTKGKKVVKKTGKGKKKVVRKAVRKEALAVPAPLYMDPEYKGLRDCYSHYVAGRKRDSPLRIRPVGMTREVDVFCDMKNEGWTVIMRRQDGATDFYRDWAEYKRGFGGTYTDHWLGLDLMHRLTNQGDYQLRVDLTDWQRNSVYALYDVFRVEGEEEGYRLHISGYTGTAGDGFLGHNGMKFSTKDKDNDLAVADFGGSCAKRFHGAWWYNKCYKSNLNGRYYRGGHVTEGQYDGVTWKAWTGSQISLKKVEMKIRVKL